MKINSKLSHTIPRTILNVNLLNLPQNQYKPCHIIDHFKSFQEHLNEGAANQVEACSYFGLYFLEFCSYWVNLHFAVIYSKVQSGADLELKLQSGVGGPCQNHTHDVKITLVRVVKLLFRTQSGII
jgi:hypothetical protein